MSDDGTLWGPPVSGCCPGVHEVHRHGVSSNTTLRPAPVAAEGTDELREAVAEALARHEPQWHDGFLTGEPDFFSCGADDQSGSGCEWVSDPESTDWANQHRLHVADLVLAGPLADLIRERDDLLAKVQAVEALAIDVAHLQRQREWSEATFGPGKRTKGVQDHITKEFVEINDDEAAGRLSGPEWIDVVILALDGAWRSGMEPQEIVAAIKAKQARNEARTWPDWRTADPDRAIEHVRALAGESRG